MVDTFEIPSACVCHYKESFGFDLGFRTAGGRFPSFGARFPIPYKEAECVNGGVISQPLKNQFLSLLDTSRPKNDTARPTEDVSDANLRPKRASYVPKRFSRFSPRRGGNNLKPLQCKGVRFGELCTNKTTDPTTVLGKYHQKYPTSIIRSIMRRNYTYKSPNQFKKFFGKPCKFEGESSVAFRFGFSFDESPVCRAHPRYIFPKVAKNVYGTHRFIVNTEEYKQGVTVVECHSDTEGKLNTVSRRNLECAI